MPLSETTVKVRHTGSADIHTLTIDSDAPGIKAGIEGAVHSKGQDSKKLQGETQQ